MAESAAEIINDIMWKVSCKR